MAIDYSKAYKKLPRSRLKSNMDGEDSIVPYNKTDSAKVLVAGPYESSPSSRKGDRQSFKSDTVTAKGQRGLSPASKPSTASANVRKEDYKAPALKKSSTQPPAYKGQDGDKPAKRGAVTSYVKDGYTYMKNAQGNFQNFSASKTPYKPKGK